MIGPNEPLLAAIRSATGGKVTDDPAAVWLHDLRPTSTFTDLWPALLILAMLLWPLDIALRRVSVGRRELARRTGLGPRPAGAWAEGGTADGRRGGPHRGARALDRDARCAAPAARRWHGRRHDAGRGTGAGPGGDRPGTGRTGSPCPSTRAWRARRGPPIERPAPPRPAARRRCRRGRRDDGPAARGEAAKPRALIEALGGPLVDRAACPGVPTGSSASSSGSPIASRHGPKSVSKSSSSSSSWTVSARAVSSRAGRARRRSYWSGAGPIISHPSTCPVRADWLGVAHAMSSSCREWITSRRRVRAAAAWPRS